MLDNIVTISSFARLQDPRRLIFLKRLIKFIFFSLFLEFIFDLVVRSLRLLELLVVANAHVLTCGGDAVLGCSVLFFVLACYCEGCLVTWWWWFWETTLSLYSVGMFDLLARHFAKVLIPCGFLLLYWFLRRMWQISTQSVVRSIGFLVGSLVLTVAWIQIVLIVTWVLPRLADRLDQLRLVAVLLLHFDLWFKWAVRLRIWLLQTGLKFIFITLRRVCTRWVMLPFLEISSLVVLSF